MNLAQSLQHPVFRIVGQAGDEMKVPVFVVGGFVRDIILNRPSKDIDFVCVGSGIDLARRVSKKAGGAHVSIFKNFT